MHAHGKFSIATLSLSQVTQCNTAVHNWLVLRVGIAQAHCDISQYTSDNIILYTSLHVIQKAVMTPARSLACGTSRYLCAHARLYLYINISCATEF